MPVTLTQLTALVAHTLGRDPVGDAAADLVNQAGVWLYYMHPWQFRLRPAATLDHVEDQPYLVLPADFGELDEVESNRRPAVVHRIVPLSDLIEARASGSTAMAGSHWVAMSHHIVSEVVTPRLDIWPTPTADSAGELTISYRATWPTLVEGTDIAAVPVYAEVLLREAVRAFARGTEEEDLAGLDARLTALSGSRLVDDVKRADGSVMPRLGHLTARHGAVARTMRRWHEDFTGIVLDP